ncbi:hypothetical protein J1N35_007463 [Gossypium stocksii]|uniref:Uncharacterized protein n=1 Tax=Gossypium stocksii TaxID=47602 RepID=A0A9D3W981_9ROSI|nr:hypothetical protein J1N35_007463 [Gossypium stocksii]
MLHCNFRKTISAIFSLLRCKLREARLVSSICFTTSSGRQDLLSLVCSAANSGRQNWQVRLVSSICFTATLGRQEDKIYYIQPAPLQTQGGKAGVFDALHCNFRRTRSVVFSMLRCKLREARLGGKICEFTDVATPSSGELVL